MQKSGPGRLDRQLAGKDRRFGLQVFLWTLGLRSWGQVANELGRDRGPVFYSLTCGRVLETQQERVESQPPQRIR